MDNNSNASDKTEVSKQGLCSYMRSLDDTELEQLIVELESMSSWERDTFRSLLEFKVEMLSEATLRKLDKEMEARTTNKKDYHIKCIAKAILVHVYQDFKEPINSIPSSAAAAIACTWKQHVSKRKTDANAPHNESISSLPPILPTIGEGKSLPSFAKPSRRRYRSCGDTFPNVQNSGVSYSQGVSRASRRVPSRVLEPPCEEFPPIDPTWEEL